MLCRKLKQTLFAKSSAKQLLYRHEILFQSRAKKSSWFDDVFIGKSQNSMSSVHKFRQIFREFNVTRLWSTWSRNVLIGSVIKKCRKERVVRGMVQCLRQTFFRPSRTLLLSVAAAYKADENNTDCFRDITDEELKNVISDLDNVDNLSFNTVFCTKCHRRLVIDKKYNGIVYCSCKDGGQPAAKSLDGWIPFLEAEDVIIWRKEYKNRSGVYAYKIYGRYKEIRAEDFAAIQVDGNYRMEWDTAVASLLVIEEQANGLKDQTVLHWEVLWPKLFQNRDYVYIRRHKDFTLKNKRFQHKDRLFNNDMPKNEEEEEKYKKIVPRYKDTENVHSRAKRLSQQQDEEERSRRIEEKKMNENKVFIILSRSCDHAEAPDTKTAIRVTEYWSHMVIRTLDGPDKAGMEFVLTYFDAPSTGVLPTGVTAWATGRAAPNYLDTMRRAADHYREWLQTQFPENEDEEIEMEKDVKYTCTQTDDLPTEIFYNNNNNNVMNDIKKDTKCKESNPEENIEKIEQESNGSWWRYFYPLYYFM